MPRAIIHFAAESHVDRSISGPSKFIETNINGTFNLLESSYEYFLTLSKKASENKNNISKNQFRFLHVSTDEVYGSLKLREPSFSENHPYKPNSPYAASKASSDFLVRAWNKTYNLPTLVPSTSNVDTSSKQSHRPPLFPTFHSQPRQQAPPTIPPTTECLQPTPTTTPSPPHALV